MGRFNSLASVVRMVQDSTASPSGGDHRSHNPANANSLPPFIRMKNGCFFFASGFCHS
jgi:hypothetical protein